MWVTGRGLGYADLIRDRGDVMDPGLVRLGPLAQKYTLAGYYRAMEARRAFNAQMFGLFEHWDLLLLPTMPGTAFAADAEMPPGGEAGAPLPWITWTPYTYPFNISGQPAISIPCGLAHGLDQGVHRQLKDAVYLQLRDDVISGALPTGAVLREAELVTRLGVSKTPLRDALVRLQKDGFVDIPPYRSAVVVGYSQTDLREIYELRELLEGACARQAALHIDGDALAQLAHIVAASAACVTGGATVPGREEELAGLIQQFDLALYAQSRNSRIDEMVGNIRGHVQRIGRLTTGIPGRRPIRSSHWLTARLASASPNGGMAAIRSASANVTSASSARGTTRFTMPSW